MNDQDLARESALTMAAQNLIWAAVPDVTPADVTFPDPCPPGPYPAGGNCIRVDVFRNQRPGGNPLPTLFGQLVGVTNQGVRATATARVLFGGSTNCLLPFAIPDKWEENYPTPMEWSDGVTFDADVPNPDVYRAPVGEDLGTGFTRESLDGETGGDFGKQMTLRFDNPQLARESAAAGWYRPVRLEDGDQGFQDFRNRILGCSNAVVGSGTSLTTENGHMSTNQILDAINEVVDRDPGAFWDPNKNEGRGGISGGCMNTSPPTCAISPRLRPIPVYDPADWTLRNGEGAGQFPLQITKVIGFFIERPTSAEIMGRVMVYPSDVYQAGAGPEGANFIITVTLVR
jgi:hypothetical protein